MSNTFNFASKSSDLFLINKLMQIWLSGTPTKARRTKARRQMRADNCAQHKVCRHNLARKICSDRYKVLASLGKVFPLPA